MHKPILFCCAVILIVSAAFADSDLGLPVGTQAPDFKAATYTGGQIQLSEVYKNNPTVLIFYRGGWCPYCNRQLQQLQSRLEEFTMRDTVIVAVSVDRQQKAAETVSEQGLGFTVVSDPTADLLRSYNIVYQVPEELYTQYKEEYGIDLEADSGETHHLLAVPAAFVIDRSGTVVFTYVNEDYKVRVEPDTLLNVLNELKG